MNISRPEQGTSESGDKTTYRDQVNREEIAQLPWGEVFQSLEIHP